MEVCDAQRHLVLDELYGLHMNEDFCDVTIYTNTDDIPCHKAVLIAANPYFKQKFSDPTIGFLQEPEFSAATVRSVLQFIYTGYFERNHDTMLAIVELAVKWKVDLLIKELLEFMKDNISVDNVVKYYWISADQKNSALLQFATGFIRKHFMDIPSFNGVTLDSLCTLLCYDELNVPNEDAVCQKVIEWIEDNSITDADDLCLLLDEIRFDHLTSTYLDLIKDSPYLSHPKLQRRITLAFSYQANNDKHGYLKCKRYWGVANSGVATPYECNTVPKLVPRSHLANGTLPSPMHRKTAQTPTLEAAQVTEVKTPLLHPAVASGIKVLPQLPSNSHVQGSQEKPETPRKPTIKPKIPEEPQMALGNQSSKSKPLSPAPALPATHGIRLKEDGRQKPDVPKRQIGAFQTNKEKIPTPPPHRKPYPSHVGIVKVLASSSNSRLFTIKDSNHLYEFDAQKKQWTFLMYGPKWMDESSIIYSNGSQVIIAGAYNTNGCYMSEIDVSKKSLFELSQLPEPVCRGRILCVGSSLFVIGGMRYDMGRWIVSNRIHEFNKDTKIWSVIYLHQAVCAPLVAVLNDEIHIMGGIAHSKIPLSSVQIYKPGTKELDLGVPMPEVCDATASSVLVVDGAIRVFTRNSQMVYSMTKNSWNEMKNSSPSVQCLVNAVELNGNIYACVHHEKCKVICVYGYSMERHSWHLEAIDMTMSLHPGHLLVANTTEAHE